MICNFLLILVDLSLLIDVETEKWWRKKKFIFQGTMYKNRIKTDEKTFQIITLCILWAKKYRAGKIKKNILMYVPILNFPLFAFYWIFSFTRKKMGVLKFFLLFSTLFFYTHHGVFILGLFILFGSVSSSSSSKQFNLPPFSLINVLWQEQRTSDDFYLERVGV